MSRADKSPNKGAPSKGPGSEPGGIIWLVGLIDLMLPWVGVPLALVGLVMGVRGYANGWWLLSLGIAMLIVDLMLTVFWSRSEGQRTDQPTLNRRGTQYIGRKVCVADAIVGGEGKVRVADTVWPARGQDCAAGTWVKVVAVDGAKLVIESIDERRGE